MKKAILIAVSVLAILVPVQARASASPVDVLLAGGPEANTIKINLGPGDYVIDSNAALQLSSSICINPPADPDELICQAAAVSGFEVDAGGGNDVVTVGAEVPIGVTLRGGPGNDELTGGGGPDKLIGGPGNDILNGGGGADSLYGGPGNDILNGGPGNDVLRGGPGQDTLIGGPGENQLQQVSTSFNRHRVG